MLTRGPSRPRCSTRMPTAFLAAFWASVGGLACENPPPVENIPTPEPELIVFPPGMRVDDPAVNEFVEHTMQTCVSGDYDAFRLLWSADSTPMGRRDFERGWHAVRQIRVDALVPFRHGADGLLRYYVEASVELDPTADPPTRNVQLVAVNEDSQWRLAKPSKTQLDQIAQGVAQPAGPAEADP